MRVERHPKAWVGDFYVIRAAAKPTQLYISLEYECARGLLGELCLAPNPNLQAQTLLPLVQQDRQPDAPIPLSHDLENLAPGCSIDNDLETGS
jgi:hypothetical protein